MTTPPAGVPPMPKIDMVRSTPEGCWHCYKVTAESPTTSIERAYATLSSMYQQERAENERLREALERVRPVVHYYDPEETGIKVNRAPRFNGLCWIIDQAITPKETTDE